MTNFQLLMLSPNLLKSKIPYMVVEAVSYDQFPTFDAEPYTVGGGGDNKFPTLDAESKFIKIQKSHYSVGRGGGWLVMTSLHLLMLSPNLLKPKKIYSRGFCHGVPLINYK